MRKAKAKRTGNIRLIRKPCKIKVVDGNEKKRVEVVAGLREGKVTWPKCQHRGALESF